MPFQSALLPLMCFLALAVGDPALPCNPALCRLPDCRCASVSIPGGLQRSETPQIVTIAMDDGIRVQDYEQFYRRFLNVHTNPNGCPIQASFFVSHDNTDYSLMERLVSQGHEIADHSVTHRLPPTWWNEADVGNLTREIAEMKTICEQWGKVPQGAIRGFRVPYLSISENELKALHNEKFLYEASMPSREQYWPFTLDYKSPLCDSPAVCPDESYPGLWIIPTPFLNQPRGPVCGMLDSCTIPQTRQEWFALLQSNFLRHYQGNKAPFGLYTHASWFYFPGERLAALNDFLSYLETLDDVYVVSHQNLLEWVRNPTPLSQIGDFEPWKCPNPPPPAPRCVYQRSTRCTYDPEGVLVLRTCETECPFVLPALGNPLGLDPAVLATLTTSEVAPTATSSVQVVTSSEVQESSSVIVSSSTSTSVIASESASETSEPVGQSTSVDPAVESTSVDPAVESTSVDPAVESTSVDPVVESTSADPTVESTSAVPAVESTSADPAVESTSVDPAVESTSVDPAVESTSVVPAVESTSFVPTPTSATTVGASSSQFVQPSSSVPEVTASISQPPQPTNPTPTSRTGASQTGDIDTTLVSAVGAAVGGVVLLSIGIVVVVSVQA